MNMLALTLLVHIIGNSSIIMYPHKTHFCLCNKIFMKFRIKPYCMYLHKIDMLKAIHFREIYQFLFFLH